MKTLKPLEHDIQCNLIEWVNDYGVKQYPKLSTLFAIPNGSLRNIIVAKKLKKEGAKAGVWDLFLPAPVFWESYSTGKFTAEIGSGYHGFWLETKRPGEKLKPEQTKFGLQMQEEGYFCWVYDDWEEAKDKLITYLTEPERLTKYNIEGRSNPFWQSKLKMETKF